MVVGEALRLLSRRSDITPAMTLTTAPSSKLMPLKRYSVGVDMAFSLSQGVCRLLASHWKFLDMKDESICHPS